jgi:hypothetical protein
MTDREILLAIRQHAEDGLQERRKYADPLHKSEAMFLVGYLSQVLRHVLDECKIRTCDCGRDRVDGSGIMCAKCWEKIGPYDTSIAQGTHVPDEVTL